LELLGQLIQLICGFPPAGLLLLLYRPACLLLLLYRPARLLLLYRHGGRQEPRVPIVLVPCRRCGRLAAGHLVATEVLRTAGRRREGPLGRRARGCAAAASGRCTTLGQPIENGWRKKNSALHSRPVCAEPDLQPNRSFILPIETYRDSVTRFSTFGFFP
jgi:hypothetical protein